MGIVTDWSKYPNFSESEFRCSHTGECRMDEEFMDRLQRMRTEYGKPMRINSGYRHWSHPVEARKGHKNGEHTHGRCCDIGVSGTDAFELLVLAVSYGFHRIGVQQKGPQGGRFLHLGMGAAGLPDKVVWSYA